MSSSKRSFAVAALVVTLLAAGCSPEATRSRSGGSGGDIGNRTADVDIHGQTNAFYQTPPRGLASEQ